jgi:flagellar motor protein MotB
MRRIKEATSKNQALQEQAAEKAKQAKPAEQAKPTLTPLQQAQQMKQKTQQNYQAVQAKLAQQKAQQDSQKAESNKIIQRAQQEQQKSRDILTQSRQALEDSRMGRPVKPITQSASMPAFQGDTRVPNVNTIGAPMPAMKRGGSVRSKPVAKFSSSGSTNRTSSRGDGIAQRGKTKGRYI